MYTPICPDNLTGAMLIMESHACRYPGDNRRKPDGRNTHHRRITPTTRFRMAKNSKYEFVDVAPHGV